MPLHGDARREIDRLRASGLGYHAIARTLNARGIPTRSGEGAWHGATVRTAVDPSGWAGYMRRYRSRAQ